MTDHFAVLRQRRRPWLESDQLKERYQELTFALHPDRKKQNEGRNTDFAAVTEAYRVLSNPRLRLNHLLSLESEDAIDSQTSDVPAELTDIFMQAAKLVNDIDAYLRKQGGTASALGKSVGKAEVAGLEKRASLLLGELERAYQKTVQKLHQADERWPNRRAETVPELKLLAQRFAYLERWIGQLREKEFQLSN